MIIYYQVPIKRCSLHINHAELFVHVVFENKCQGSMVSDLFHKVAQHLDTRCKQCRLFVRAVSLACHAGHACMLAPCIHAHT